MLGCNECAVRARIGIRDGCRFERMRLLDSESRSAAGIALVQWASSYVSPCSPR